MLAAWLFFFALLFGSNATIEVSHIAPTTLQPGDQFGFYVAATSDLMAVSAPFSNSFSGSVYIYQCLNGSPSSCTQTQILTSPNAAPNDTFGYSVAVLGESYVAVAALLSDISGVVFIYNCSDPRNCTLESNVTAPMPSAGDWYGYFSQGDEMWLLVGAPGRNNNTGQAFLYNCQDPKKCVLTFTFTPQNGSAGDKFGYGIGLYDWLVVIGAGYQNQGDGMAYAYNCSIPANCTLIASLSPGNVVQGGNFGNIIFVADGGIAYITAAYQYNTSGYTFAYNCSTGKCVLASMVEPDTALNPGDQFGAFVATYDNIVVISAQGQNNNTGAAYVFDCSDATNCMQTNYLNGSDSSMGDYFSWMLAVTETMIISTAPYHHDSAGELYTYWNNQTSTST
jgi:hypothetical protein